MKDKQYFGKEVQEAIKTYTAVKDELLYRRIIHPALETLVENVFHNMKFYDYGSDTYSIMKSECITYVYERLHGYTKDNHLAFSYFNRIVINWVLAQRKKITLNYSRIGNENEIPAYIDTGYTEFQEELCEFMNFWSTWCLQNIYILFPKKRYRRIADAIFTIIKNRNSIDNFNKKAIFIWLREQVPEVKTQHITEVLSLLKPFQKEMFVEFLKNGTAKWEYYIEEVR